MANQFEKHGQPSWPEQDLVSGILADDAEACSAFVNLCHDAVYAYTCRLCNDASLRRDWTHDCILRLMRDIADESFTFRGPGSLWAWFRKRAWYLVLEIRRTHHRHQLREISDGGVAQDQLVSQADPLQDLESAQITAAVAHCLDEIENPDHRHALRLLLYRNLDYQEIAREMDSPLNTIRAWVRRGRLNLRRCLTLRLELERFEK